MKKTAFVFGAVLTAGLVLASCGSTKEAASSSTEVSKEISASMDENNTSVAARKTQIIDWQNRTIGAKVNPEWLLSITQGNGTKYVDMYGLSKEYANHKWFCSSAQNASKDVAQAIAESDVLYALASEMANTVNSTLGNTISDGEKDAIRTVCSKVNNVKLTGIGNRGSYWQLELTTDEYGNTQRVYNYYAVYSCSRSIYNQLLNVYMVELLKSKELDEKTVNTIAQNAQQILNDAQEQSERVEKAKEREWVSEIVHEENKIRMEREKTMQVQATSAAEAAKNMPAFSSVNIPSAGNAQMSPAMVELLKGQKNN